MGSKGIQERRLKTQTDVGYDSRSTWFWRYSLIPWSSRKFPSVKMVLSTFSLQIVTRIKGSKIYQNILLSTLCIEGIPQCTLASFLPMVPLLLFLKSLWCIIQNPDVKEKKNWKMTESRLNNISICWSIETGKKWTEIIKDMWKLALVSLSHMNDGVGCMHVCVGEHSLHRGLLWWNITRQLLEVMVALWPALVRPSREHCVASGSHRVWKGTLIHHYIPRDITSMVIALSMASDWGTLVWKVED